MKRKFLAATWKNLIMANYIIDPSVLIPYLPANTELDTYNGNAYLSLVGFMFEDTRVIGIKIPFHINFEEVNLRFYVRFNDNGKWKRGVVFIKEFVPKRAISFVANIFYREKYSAMPMKHFEESNGQKIRIGYQWNKNDRWNCIEATVENNAVDMQEGSEQEFIAEHYWGYSKYSNKITFEYEVSHPRWKIYPLIDYTLDCNFKDLYGNEFAFLQNASPNSVFVAQGSPIAVLQKGII